FNQPNVQESKDNTKAVLEKAGDGPLPEGDPLLVDGAIEVHCDRELAGGASSIAGVVDALLAAVPDRGYLAVMAYLDRLGDASAGGEAAPHRSASRFAAAVASRRRRAGVMAR